jgi:cell division control protein 6
MSLFKDMLHSDESLFRNEVALDFDFIPKNLPYREEQQKYVATCIAPLMKGRNGKNIFIHGAPGIGKTASLKWVLRDLEENTDEVEPIYINCWQKNTTYKVILEMCEMLGYRFTQNKKTDDLFRIIMDLLNMKAAVFIFDEVDKLEDFDFLYSIAEGIFKKTMILVTNYKEWLMSLDDRIKSRLSLETLEFPRYKPHEIEGILKERVKYAFYDVWDDEAFDEVVNKAVELGDVRQGIYLLRQAGLAAENQSKRRISLEHAKEATSKVEDFHVKSSTDLEEDTGLMLDVIKEKGEGKIGELFKSYKDKGGKNSYKTMQRKVEKLEKAGFIETYKTSGGDQGNTTIIKYKGTKTLNDF